MICSTPKNPAMVARVARLAQGKSKVSLYMKLRKIVISGLGGVGGYYGAMLNEYARREAQGREVYFIARGEHLRHIRERGLHLSTPTRDMYIHPTKATDQASELGKADLLILATKSYDLEENIQQLMPLIAPHTIILPLLNGANISEQIKALVPEAEVWQGCTYISARRPRAGEVMLENDRESLYFGAGQEVQTDAEAELLDLLLASGVNAHNPRDIALVIRKKFIMISATATGTSYYDMTVGEALNTHPQEMRALIEEVCMLSEAEGYELGGDAVEAAIKRQHIMPAESTSSMHIDFMNGTPTELENLTGYVVHRAKALGVLVPTYIRMYEKLKR